MSDNILDRYQSYRTRKFIARQEKTGKWFLGWRTQQRRRILVRLLIVLFVAEIATGISGFFIGEVASLVYAALALFFIPLWSTLQIVSSRQGDAPADALDEWEVQERNKARSIGLSVTQFLTLVPAFVIYIVAVANDSGDNTNVAFAGALLVIISLTLGGCTPSMILAWTRPDPDPEDF